jgi:hypothetical protein
MTAARFVESGPTLRLVAGEVTVGLDCELGDWRHFFSSERLGGLDVTVRDWSARVSDARAVRSGRVHYGGGALDLTLEDELARSAGEGGVVLRRRYRARALDAMEIGDFVLRLTAGADRFARAAVGGVEYDHTGTNLYRSRPVPQARLGPGARLPGLPRLMSRSTGHEGPPGLEPVTYVRDEPGGLWILHHRLLVSNPTRVFVKIIRGNRTLDLPRVPSQGLPWGPLWLCRERRWPGCPLQVVGTVPLPSGAVLGLESEVTVDGA